MNKTELDRLRDLLVVQGYSGNWNYTEYMWGMYNGLELALATMENREPVFKDKPKKFMNEPDEDSSWRDRLHKAWGKK